MEKAIGIDIGGTKIAAGIINKQGELENSFEIPSIPDDSEGLFRAIMSLIKKLLMESKIEQKDLSLGIGIPGLVDTEQGVAVFQNNLNWRDFPIVERLRSLFPEIPSIVIDNDVYQTAFVEWYSLKLGRQDSLAFFTVSTGISSPIIVGGKGIKGMGFAGEICLTPVCLQGEKIRLEEAASGPAIAKAGQLGYGVPTMTTAEVFNRYYAEEHLARKIIDDAEDALAQGVYTVISLMDPSKIIFGGSVMMKNPQLIERVKEKLEEKIIPIQRESLARLELSQYENNAGLIGAGLRALSEHK